MKLVVAALLVAGTALADQSSWDRAEHRRERAEMMRAQREARRDTLRAGQEMRQTRAAAARARVEARREAVREGARERRRTLAETRAARTAAVREAARARREAREFRGRVRYF